VYIYKYTCEHNRSHACACALPFTRAPPLDPTTVCCSVLQYVAVCRSVLQCVAVCCSVLQCVAVCCSVKANATCAPPRPQHKQTLSFMHIHVCIYVHICIPVYYLRIHMNMNMHTYVHIYIYIYGSYIYVQISVIFSHICVFLTCAMPQADKRNQTARKANAIYTYMYLYTYIHIHINMYTYDKHIFSYVSFSHVCYASSRHAQTKG